MFRFYVSVFLFYYHVTLEIVVNRCLNYWLEQLMQISVIILLPIVKLQTAFIVKFRKSRLTESI